MRITNIAREEDVMISFQWFGHSMWLIKGKDISIVIDPFTDIGYNIPQDLNPDIVISSHDHFDHNNFSIFKNNFTKITTPGPHNVKGLNIEGFETFHDEKKGELRGVNIIFKILIDGFTVVHFGDIGHEPDPGVLNKLNDTDVMMIPVGGYYTIDASQAHKIVTSSNPSIVLPMHYKTKTIDFPIAPVDEYLNYVKNFKKIDSNVISITDKDLQEKTTIVLDYEK